MAGPQIGTSGPAVYDVSWLEDNTRRVLVVGNEQPQPNTGAQVLFVERSGVKITRFRLSVPAGQQSHAQVHRENLTIRYQCLDSQGRQIGATQEQPASVELSVTVPRYVAAYIGSAGQTRGTINFGDVGQPTANLRKSVNVTALSTLPYAVRFESENGGLLKRRSSETHGIIYGMNYAVFRSVRAIRCCARSPPRQWDGVSSLRLALIAHPSQHCPQGPTRTR